MELLAREYATSIATPLAQVLNWISSGAIDPKLVRRAGRRVFVRDPSEATEALKTKGLIGAPKARSPEQGSEQWETRSLDEWETKERYFKAATAELEYEVKKKRFLPAEEVQLEVDKMIVATKTKLLAVPSQLAQRVDVPKVVRELVDSLIREALEELSDELTGDEP